jgi:Na+/H+ antiporter NhaD/arsenite permease-like protein
VGDPPNIVIASRADLTFDDLLLHPAPIVLVILAAFLLQPQTGVTPAVVALMGAGVMILLATVEPRDLLVDVEWETLLFFVGLVLLVGALVHVGALDRLAEQIAGVTDGSVAPTLMVMLVGSAVVSAVVDNIPYVTAMTPVVESLVGSHPGLGSDGGLWWALALGADLGGNATLVGASAIVGIAASNSLHISFAQWLTFGIAAAAVSIAISVPLVLV